MLGEENLKPGPDNKGRDLEALLNHLNSKEQDVADTDPEKLLQRLQNDLAKNTDADKEERLKAAVKMAKIVASGRAGISKKPPHHIVSLDDEPDAMPMPKGKNPLLSIHPNQALAAGKKHRGPNYTPPKQKRKKGGKKK